MILTNALQVNSFFINFVNITRSLKSYFYILRQTLAQFPLRQTVRNYRDRKKIFTSLKFYCSRHIFENETEAFIGVIQNSSEGGVGLLFRVRCYRSAVGRSAREVIKDQRAFMNARLAIIRVPKELTGKLGRYGMSCWHRTGMKF